MNGGEDVAGMDTGRRLEAEHAGHRHIAGDVSAADIPQPAADIGRVERHLVALFLPRKLRLLEGLFTGLVLQPQQRGCERGQPRKLLDSICPDRCMRLDIENADRADRLALDEDRRAGIEPRQHRARPRPPPSRPRVFRRWDRTLTHE